MPKPPLHSSTFFNIIIIIIIKPPTTNLLLSQFLAPLQFQSCRPHKELRKNGRQTSNAMPYAKSLTESSRVSFQVFLTYNPTEAQSECRGGSLQEKLSNNHRDLDLVARHPHTEITLIKKSASIRSLNNLEILIHLCSFKQRDIELRIANSEGNLIQELKEASRLPILRTHASIPPFQ